MNHTRDALRRQVSPVTLAIILVMAWVVLGGVLSTDEAARRDPAPVSGEEAR